MLANNQFIGNDFLDETSDKSSDTFRLLVVASHPIQYQAPFFRKIAKCPEIDLHVCFCSDVGLKEYKDEGFGKTFSWDIPLLDGYNYEFLPNVSLFPNASTFWGLINPSIINKISKSNFDAVWIHGWNNFTNWLVMFVAFCCGVPILIRGESNLLKKDNFIKDKVKKMIFSQVFKYINGFLAIGKLNKEFYKIYGVPDEKIFMVPYCVNNDFFMCEANRLLPIKDELKKKHGLNIDFPVVLFSGKLIPQKSPLALLKAYELMIKEINASLVFVGDGVLRKEIEYHCVKKNIKNVHVTGFVNQTAISEYYALADVFVLPSDFEQWGLVVNEAMCFGLPVIVSDQVGSGSDLVKQDENGYVFKMGDYEALAEKLLLLLKNDNQRNLIGQKSRQIIENWSYNEDILGILSCLSNLKRQFHAC